MQNGIDRRNEATQSRFQKAAEIAAAPELVEAATGSVPSDSPFRVRISSAWVSSVSSRAAWYLSD